MSVDMHGADDDGSDDTVCLQHGDNDSFAPTPSILQHGNTVVLALH